MKSRSSVVFGAVLALLLGLVLFSGCGSRDAEESHDAFITMPELTAVRLETGERLSVVATTSIVADVVRHVGGDDIELVRLMPLGADPHAFEPTPRDVAAVADAHVVFINGAGLETFIEDLLRSADEDVKVVPVSYGIDMLAFDVADEHEVSPAEDEEADHDYDRDPHTWFDPNNVVIWVDNIREALGALDPSHREAYEARAAAYQAQLLDLDVWIRAEVEKLDPARRKLVTDHASLTYFADEYGFEQVGIVIPGYSTLAEPSAQQLAALQETMEELDVSAVFVGVSANESLAQQVAADTGVELVFLYTGSLSDVDGPASTYLDFTRYNVMQIVSALE